MEEIDSLTDMVLFWIGCSGRHINWENVEARFGSETSERLQREIK